MTADRIPALLEPIQNRLNAANLGPLGLSMSEDRRWGLLLENPGTRDERLVAKYVDDDEAQLFANAPTDQARLLAAVQAVTALHKPFTHHFLTPPAGSLEVCSACHEAYPCPTVAAVVAALGGES